LATIELIQIMNHLLFSVDECLRQSFCSQNPFDGALVFEVVDVTDSLSLLAAGAGVAIMVGLDSLVHGPGALFSANELSKGLSSSLRSSPR
jgi:hypothetical protein